MRGKNGILLLLLAALVLGPILWQIAPRAMVTPEEADETAELCLGEGDPWLAGLLTLTDPEEIRETLDAEVYNGQSEVDGTTVTE